MGRRRGTLLSSLILTALALFACDDPVEPTFGESPYSHCVEDNGIEVCVEKAEYPVGSLIPFTVSNGLDRQVFQDRCTGRTEFRASPADDWSPVLISQCAVWVTREDILREMRALPSGDVVHDTTFAGSATDGQARFWIGVLDADGEPIRSEPFYSPVFSITSEAR